MSRRTAARLALAMLACSATMTALALWMLFENLARPNVHLFDYWLEDTAISLVFSAVGAMIAYRRPENLVGWIFCALGLSVGLDHLVAEYAIYALLASHRNLPWGEATAWIRSWIWVVYLGLFVFLGLLFPDGRLPSPRWRPFAWLSASVVMLGALATSLSPGRVDGLGPIRNPLGVPGVPNLVWLVNWAVLVPTLVAAVSLLVRLGYAEGEERQQLKWFAYAAIMASGGAILAYPLSGATSEWWIRWGGFALFMVGIVGLPAAVAVAILRYRLYGIDIIINRTLVYGPLTALLAGLYVCSVVLLQDVFQALIGESSHFAVVASTLAIAASFAPLRRRIQALVDRRFYRSKYDAKKTLDEFAARLRDETDLDRLGGDLVEVVSETMQPAHVGLWLRPDTAYKGSKGEEP
ncbi:MAG: hypothetical protein M3305_00385 [Actinomycetota bacterium]|nr:hypothetical protein [Actinomycetota bacterium]